MSSRTARLPIRRRLIASSVLMAVSLSGTVALAVGTTLWQLDTARQLEQGELEHVVLSSEGEVKLGRSTTKVVLEDVALVWSSLRGPDGWLYLGTGNTGKVLRVKGAKVEEAAETESLVVTSLATGEGGVIYAGTLPEGKVYRLDTKAKGGIKGEVHTELAEADHVWALQYDAKRKVLFAGTGPKGIVYAIDSAGRAEVYFETTDDHVLSLHLSRPGGELYAGTSPKARLLDISGPGRAVAMYDFDATEVKGIDVAGDGDLFVAVNTFPDPPSLPKTSSTVKTKTKSSVHTRPKPGKGKIFHRRADGTIESVLEFEDGHLTSIQALDDGLVYAGTGAKGRIVAVGRDRITYTIADVEERQVLSLALEGDDPVFTTGDVGSVYKLGAAAAGLAEYRTPPLDAGFISTWGRVEWRGDGQLLVQTRSGHTEEPDGTWSDWSAPIARSGELIESPAARYLQLRVKWSRDPSAVLRALGVYHVRNNQRPVITKIVVESPYEVDRPEVKSKAKAATVETSAAERSSKREKATTVKLSWTVENPDEDTLRYRLYFREESGATWHAILPSDTVLTKTTFDWNTEAVPAGYYLVKVEASDEIDNPDPRVLRHEKLTSPIVIDNQPPRVIGLKVAGRGVKGKAVDATSPIHRIEYSLDGLQWLPVFTDDGLFDSRSESFSFELPSALAPGPYTIAVRAYDRAQNDSVGRAVTTVP